MIRRTARFRPALRSADLRLGERLLAAVVAFAVAAVPAALLLVLVEANWPPLHRLDSAAAAHLHSAVREHPAVLSALRVLSNVVWDPVTMRLLVAAAVLWLLWRRAWRLAVWAAATVAASGLIGLAVKSAVARARPALPDPVAHAPGFSFPSGHAMTAATCCAVLLLVFAPVLRPPWRAAAGTVAVLSVLGVGFTRVALGVHWVSDVVGGWLLGLALVAATGWAFEGWRRDTGRPVPPLAEGLEPELAPDGPPRPEDPPPPSR
ncbi:phosphatase PAP2 family protein [Streptomyces sp. TLI_171]|uniref:phosphatase PAP2 family protein n=1 Tax=Streptomyces sp. TLI_171 TaxID=1938859 RepID=UPI000C1931BF|nr:phosphatase PAP2 family protein [Streptomyces sp. TLI_171]RKE17370.1 undecaprenyl-diphosphatase [Streptomyces sp. TLI_171]